ncbi:cytochrome b5 [Lanmaoa asiatica]|nr:cytochrome b5 [Lanmaoa asiatica]
MSWIWNPSGNASKPQPAEEMVQDPGDPNRMVSKKAANQPFLAYHEYKLEQERLHQAWLQCKKEREEKLARGEEVGPEERDPTAEEEVGLLGLLKFIVYLLLIISLAGKFFTGSFLWEYDGKWARLKTYWPEPSGRLFSESYLVTFDGTDANKPIYIAIDGDVYDVSSNRRTYGPGGPYHNMYASSYCFIPRYFDRRLCRAGIDAARSFGTGCFATHRTHDLRGLTDQELRGVQHWKNFFADHKTYFKSYPEHCDAKKEQTMHPTKGSDDGSKPWVQPGPSTNGEPEHQEL